MKNDTIQTRKWITTCLMALLTFCLVLTGIFFIAPIEAEAAVGDEFTVNKMEYRVLTEEEGNYTVEVSDAYYVTDAGISTFVIPVQPLNAFAPTVVSVFGSSNAVT